MKKSITKTNLLKSIAILFLLIGSTVNAQTFVRKYDGFIKNDRVNNEITKLQDTKLSVFFSGNDKGDIIFYFDSGEVQRYYKVGTIKSGVSKDNLKYRYITTVDEDGAKVAIQLFDNGVLRVHKDDYYMEYKEEKAK
jgi:hypothetical protein